MIRRHGKSGFLQSLMDFIRNQDRAMVASGAAKRNRKIALSFAYVVRQQVNEQI